MICSRCQGFLCGQALAPLQGWRKMALAALALVSAQAEAGTWEVVGPSKAGPGEIVTLLVQAAGDSRMVAGQVVLDFDDALLAVAPVGSPAQSVVGLNRGECRQVGARTINILTSETSETLASSPTPFCSVTLRVSRTVPTSTARMRLAGALCIDAQGGNLDCRTIDLPVAIAGNIETPGGGIVYLDDSRYIEVMLRHAEQAPTVEQVLAFDFSRDDPPIAALRGLPVLGVSALIQPRASEGYRRILERYPQSPRARLERYLVVRVPPDVDYAPLLERLRADPVVEAAFGTLPVRLPISAGSTVAPRPGLKAAAAFGSGQVKSVANQYHLAQLNLTAAWQFTLGWGHVGVLDTGIDTTHPDLVPFSASGQFVGGNFMSARSFDTGRLGIPNGSIDYDVDERQAMPLTGNEAALCANSGIPNLMIPTSAGHGTHVVGLVAANHLGGNGIEGVCGRCGTAMAKISDLSCSVDSTVVPPVVSVVPGVPARLIPGDPFDLTGSRPTVVTALTTLTQNGFQVLNLSFGGSGIEDAYCGRSTNNVPHSSYSYCLALAFASEADVAVVSAAGNDRTFLNFPAQEPNVVSVGGVDSLGGFWNDDPDPAPLNLDGCLQPPAVPTAGAECGSNKTMSVGGPRQELAAPAKSTQSLAYRGFDWNVGISCGDSVGGANGDGIGPCTGTSMSSPIVAGIFGIYRSVNPLVPVGAPEGPASGIRGVMASTTFQAGAGIPWAMDFGYGIPDVERGVKKLLGVVRGQQVRNRLVPLFSVYSSVATDYAQLAIPQSVAQLIRTGMYRTQPLAGEFIEGRATPGYGTIRGEAALGAPAARADAYVLTTQLPPWNTQRPLVPLYSMSRPRNWPVGCVTGTAGCNSSNIDIVLLVDTSQLEFANANGYKYLGVQGYVFARCTPEPSCMPPGTVKLYLQCNLQQDDCAVFPEGRKAEFESALYNIPFPTSSTVVLGYAYPNMMVSDGDGDGLADVMETSIGTNPVSADSDGDGIADGIEYPFANVPVSDPCTEGAANTCLIPRDGLFASGFEAP